MQPCCSFKYDEIDFFCQIPGKITGLLQIYIKYL